MKQVILEFSKSKPNYLGLPIIWLRRQDIEQSPLLLRKTWGSVSGQDLLFPGTQPECPAIFRGLPSSERGFDHGYESCFNFPGTARSNASSKSPPSLPEGIRPPFSEEVGIGGISLPLLSLPCQSSRRTGAGTLAEGGARGGEGDSIILSHLLIYAHNNCEVHFITQDKVFLSRLLIQRQRVVEKLDKITQLVNGYDLMLLSNPK